MAGVQVELVRRVRVEDHGFDTLTFRSMQPDDVVQFVDGAEVCASCVVSVKANDVHLTAQDLRALAAVLDEWASFAEQEQAEGVED